MKGRDSFDAAPVRVVGRVTKLDIHLRIIEAEDSSLTHSGTYEFYVPDSSGGGGGDDYRTGDLKPHLTSAQKTAVKKFLEALLTKAQAAGS